jgi:predicted RND superfamily exporter protein
MRTWFERIADIIIAYPKTLLVVLLLFLVGSIYPATQISTNFDLEGFFPVGDPVIHDYDHLIEEFGRDDNVILVGFQSEDLFTKPVLADLRDLTDQAQEIPFIENVRSLWSARQITNTNGTLRFDTYLPENANLDSLNLSEIRSSMLQDSLLRGRLLNADGTTAFALQIADGHNHFFDRKVIIDDLHQLLDSYPEYKFHITGIPYFRNQYVSLLNTEIVLYVSISTVLILLLLWFLYRKLTGVLLPMVIVWATILLTVGFMSLTGGYFEILSSTIAPILLCVGVADSIHLMSKYDEHKHQPLRPSLKDTIVTLGSATFLTSVTTAIGFATLMSSSVMPMKRFGIYTAVGVIFAYLITMLALPSIIQLLGIRRFNNNPEGTHSSDAWFAYILHGIYRFTRNNYKLVLAGAGLIVLSSAYGIYKLEINGRVFDDIGQDSELIRDSQFFSEHLTPPFPMEFILAPEGGNIKDPEWLKQADRFEQYIQSEPHVKRTTSLLSLIRSMDQALNPDRIQRVPDSPNLISQYLLLLELNNEDALSKFADFDYRKMRISAQLYDVGSKEINELRSDIQAKVNSILPDTKVTVTGTTVLSAAINDKMVSALASSIGLAFVGISLIMALLFRNLKLVIISLLPNILPLLAIAGIMGYFGITIKPSTAVIFTIAFGIAVDDTIHYLARFRVEYRKSGDFMAALQRTTARTGKAIIITSIILVTGFGSLVFSEFNSTMLMGVLVSITIGIALLADLFFLPALFLSLRPKLPLPEEVQARRSESVTNGQPTSPSHDPKSADEPSVWEASHQS